MPAKKILGIVTMGICLIAADFFADVLFQKVFVVKEAEARLGRPITPGSVAGVARRTTRRTIRRTTVLVATLPRGCTTVVIEGVQLHQCGGTYYQPYRGQYVVVHVD
jgi:hypothetical protein